MNFTQNHKPVPPQDRLEKLVQQISFTHESLHATAIKAVDSSLVLRNFLIGFYITEFEGGGIDWSAIYGKHFLKDLAKRLKDSGLRGVSATSLRLCRRFYECYQKMGQALPAPSKIQGGDRRPSGSKSLENTLLEMEQALPAPSFYPTENKNLIPMTTPSNIKPDRKPEYLLFQVLIDWALDLTLPIRKETIDDKTVFFVDDNALIACFDDNITESFVKKLTEHTPLRVVFKDTGLLSNDALKINIEQIFKQLSPGTEVKSI